MYENERIIKHNRNLAMTNEQLKQQAIQEAYGDKYKRLSPFIDKEGYCIMYDDKGEKISPNFNELGFTQEYVQEHLCSGLFANGLLQWRPKSLSGLQNNNGWTRIEQYGSNLPAKFGKYQPGLLGEDGTWTQFSEIMDMDELIEYACAGQITHYRPVVEHPKPVY